MEHKARQRASFVKQAAILATASIVVRFIGFLYRIPLTNLIGDTGNGIYAAGYNMYTLFLIMSSAGLPAAISKMVSERVALNRPLDAHRVFKVSLAVSSVLGGIGSLALFLGAKAFSEAVKSPDSYYSILTLSPTVLIVGIMAVFRGYFQGMKNTVPTAISQVIEQIFNAVFSVYMAFLLMPLGVAYGAAGGTAGTGIGALAGLLTILVIFILVRPVIMKRIRQSQRHYGSMTREPISKIATELIMTAMPIIVGTAIFSLTNLIDMVMVNDRLLASGAFTATEIQALYGQLSGKYVTLTTMPVSISTAFATVAVPTIASSAVVNNKAAVRNKINMALRMTMMLSIPAAVGIGVLGNQILSMLFPLYPGGGILLQIGSVSIIFFALAQISTGILQGTGYTYVPAIAALCGGLVKIPLNYVLISNPAINVSGAVISTVGCCFVSSIINLIVLARTSGVVPDMKGVFLKPLFAAGVMGISCYIIYFVIYFLLPSNTLALIIAIAAGMCIYGAALIIVGGIRRGDMERLPFGRRIADMLSMR